MFSPIVLWIMNIKTVFVEDDHDSVVNKKLFYVTKITVLEFNWLTNDFGFDEFDPVWVNRI